MMPSRDDLVGLVKDLESNLAKTRNAPGAHQHRFRLFTGEALSRLAAADPGFAFEVMAADQWLTAICFNRIPEVVAALGNRAEAAPAVRRVREMLGNPERILMEIAETAAGGSAARQVALDELSSYIAGRSEGRQVVRLTYWYLQRILSLSPEHGEALLSMAVPAACEINIDDYQSYYTVRDFAECLENRELYRHQRGMLQRRLRSCQDYWEIEGQLRLLRLKLERARESLKGMPETQAEYLEQLDRIKNGRLHRWVENTGERVETSRCQGGLLCVGVGGGQHFFEEFAEPIFSILNLLSDVDIDLELADDVIDWSRCDLELIGNLSEYVDDIVDDSAYFEWCLSDNDLLESPEPLPSNELPVCEADAGEVWIREEIAIPLMKDMWKAFSFVAESILPVIEARINELSARQENCRAPAGRHKP